jgi:hypothetical protein
MSFPKIALPRMIEVRQVIPSPKLEDFVSEIRKELKKAGLSSKIETGAKIAITAGSRGIGLRRLRRLVAILFSYLLWEAMVVRVLRDRLGC